VPDGEFKFVSVHAILIALQHDSIIALADCMNDAARQLDLNHLKLTPDELRAEAAKLKSYADCMFPGGVADATGVPA
jgi:hypothetical protein